MIDLDAMQMFKYQCSLKMCVSEKYNIASELTNENVLAGGVCTQMLAQARGLDLSRLLKLSQVQTELKASLEDMLALVDEVLHPEPYSREEVCKALGITSEQFSTELLSANTQHGEQQRCIFISQI